MPWLCVHTSSLPSFNLAIAQEGPMEAWAMKGFEYEAAGAVPGPETAVSEEEKVILELLRASL